MDEKIFIAEYTKEATEQLFALSVENQDKILAAVRAFEYLGTKYKNINKLDLDVYEIKPHGVRTYFKYCGQKIIIIGLVVLKKTQKAPKRYIEQAARNIDNYIRNKNDGNK